MHIGGCVSFDFLVVLNKLSVLVATLILWPGPTLFHCLKQLIKGSLSPDHSIHFSFSSFLLLLVSSWTPNNIY